MGQEHEQGRSERRAGAGQELGRSSKVKNIVLLGSAAEIGLSGL